LCTQAIELALEQANNASAETTIFLDDSTRNIVAGTPEGSNNCAGEANKHSMSTHSPVHLYSGLFMLLDLQHLFLVVPTSWIPFPTSTVQVHQSVALGLACAAASFMLS